MGAGPASEAIMWHRQHRLPIAGLLFFAFANPGLAAPDPAPDPEDLEKLEAELSAELAPPTPGPESGSAPLPPVAPTLNTALQRVAMLPDISAVFTAGAFWWSDEPSVRFPAHEPLHDRDGFRFQVQELEIALQSFVDPFARADVYLAFGLEGVEVEEAFVTSLALLWNLKGRVGSFFNSFGRFATQHFLEVSPFIDLPLVTRHFFGGEQLRGLGAEASWLAPLPWYTEFIVDVTSANNGVSFGIPIEEMSGVADLLTVGHAKQSWDLSDWLYLQWGLSAAQGGNASGGSVATAENRTWLFGTDLFFKWRSLTSMRSLNVQAEWITRRISFPGGDLLEGGAYLQVDWRFDRNWAMALRSDVFGLPSTLNGDLDFEGDLVPYFSPSRQWRTGASISHYASEFHRWRLQYNFDHVLEASGGWDRVGRPIHEVFLQYQFVLGSHGAHPF
jgi:hypothetical protein